MKIEEGKFYVLKSGEVVGPVVWDSVIDVWRRNSDFNRKDGDYWHPNGSRYGHTEDNMDFASEAPSQPKNNG